MVVFFPYLGRITPDSRKESRVKYECLDENVTGKVVCKVSESPSLLKYDLDSIHDVLKLDVSVTKQSAKHKSS